MHTSIEYVKTTKAVYVIPYQATCEISAVYRSSDDAGGGPLAGLSPTKGTHSMAYRSDSVRYTKETSQVPNRNREP